MDSTKRRLGRGLEALIAIDEKNNEEVKEIKIEEIEPSLNQPRKKFDNDKLEELAKSIKKYGIVQPIIVKRDNECYRIVAGERRWRAAKKADLKTIPAIIKDLSEQEMMEVTLIENLQREDLNPIEEAEAYEILIKEYKITQEELSDAVGKSRSAIANALRLLTLDDEIKRSIMDGKITSGHARAILGLKDMEAQKKIVKEIIENDYSVRDTEKLIKEIREQKVKTRRLTEEDPIIKSIEESLKEALGTKVRLSQGKKAGRIIIEYYSQEELNRIIEILKRRA